MTVILTPNNFMGSVYLDYAIEPTTNVFSVDCENGVVQRYADELLDESDKFKIRYIEQIYPKHIKAVAVDNSKIVEWLV